MRVLVTGAAGHVGGAIARRLSQAGLDVAALVRHGNAAVPPESQVTVDIGTAEAADAIAAAMSPCEAIVHAAASLDKGLHSASVSLSNCLGTQQLLLLASRWHCGHFLFISSVPVIGLPRQHPITEDHPVAPPTAYHASKVYGEQLVRLAGDAGMAAASLRLTAPIGPGMAANRILAVFVRQALANKPIQLAGRGTRRQDYVDVRDVAMAVEKCLRAGASGLYNVASGRAVSNEELAQRCMAVLGCGAGIEWSGKSDPEDGVAWEVSIHRARESFGYEPEFALEDSIRELAAEYASGNCQ